LLRLARRDCRTDRQCSGRCKVRTFSQRGTSVRAAVSTASIVPRTLDRTSRRPRNDHTETTITKRRMGGNDIMNGKTATFCVLLLAAAAVHAQTPIPDQVDAVCTRADLQAAADS